MIRKLLSAGCCAVLVAGSTCFGADWLELPGAKYSSRLAVTIENASDVDNEAAIVQANIADLAKTLSDAKADTIAVAPAEAVEAAAAQADKHFVPFQVNGQTLVFAVPLKAHETKHVFIYSAKEPVVLPGFAAKTGFDNRHAYRSFENNLMAFRCETGPGANTTGLAIDMFGKSAKGKGLRLVEIYEQNDYHHPQVWGVDILKVGTGPGLGGAYVVMGDEMGRTAAETTSCSVIAQGPVQTIVRFSGPVEMGGRHLTMARTLTLYGDDRSVHDVVEVSGENVENLSIGVGLRDLPNQVWVEQPKSGYAMVTGSNNQPGCKAIGLAAVFNGAAYVRTIDLPDKKNGGHVYVLKPNATAKVITSEHRFAGIWDGDGQVNNPAALEATLKRWAVIRAHPPVVKYAEESEKR